MIEFSRYNAFLFLAFVFVCSSSLIAQGLDPDCNRTNFDPERTLVTFYGDSLGDYIDQEGYGYFGWETYLTIQNPQINWKIQNLAAGGWTTRDVYNLISHCSRNEINRNAYKTADNVAIEIGGNDYRDNLALLMWMPWKLGAVDQRVTYNTRVLVRMLRNPLRRKNVLLMGNFPAIAKSPTLGNYTDYFVYFKYWPTGQLMNAAEVIKNEKIKEQWNEAVKDLMQTLVYNFDQAFKLIRDALIFDGTVQSMSDMKSYFDGNISPTGQDEWYWRWLQDSLKNPISHVISIGLLIHQPSLEAMVNEENAYNNIYTYTEENKTPVTISYTAGGVRFLPLYTYFLRQTDAFYGHPYVANPNLYSDLVHLNHVGYYLWSYHVEKKFSYNFV